MKRTMMLVSLIHQASEALVIADKAVREYIDNEIVYCGG